MELSSSPVIRRPADAKAGSNAVSSRREKASRDPLLERAALYLRAAGVGDEGRVVELVDEAARQQVRPYGVVPRGDRHVRLFEAAKALAGEHGVDAIQALPQAQPRAMPAQPLGILPGVLRPDWWTQQARWVRGEGGGDPGFVVPCPERSPA